jgi:hypothetical protein
MSGLLYKSREMWNTEKGKAFETGDLFESKFFSSPSVTWFRSTKEFKWAEENSGVSGRV